MKKKLAKLNASNNDKSSLSASCSTSIHKSKENIKIKVSNEPASQSNSNMIAYEQFNTYTDKKALNNDEDDDTDTDTNYDDNGDDFDPFQRTGYIFGCLVRDIKHRYTNYCSDFKDALNLHCVVALIFTFTVCIAPALSFGGILADKTNKWFGINEMLIAVSLNGIIMGILSGQPLMIMGPTGPFLVFEEMIYMVNAFCITPYS